LRDYRINGRKSLPDALARWRLHLQPFFGNLRSVEVSSDLVARYSHLAPQHQLEAVQRLCNTGVAQNGSTDTRTSTNDLEQAELITASRQ
jgi:hypothetical protein